MFTLVSGLGYFFDCTQILFRNLPGGQCKDVFCDTTIKDLKRWLKDGMFVAITRQCAIFLRTGGDM